MAELTFVEIISCFFMLYFIILNVGYVLLNALSIVSLHRLWQDKFLDSMPQGYSGMEPPVSILLPAYNEEAIIVASVRSILQLEYPEFEIIVINDGSSDQTLEILQREFSLIPYPDVYRIRLPTQPVQAIYRSHRYPNLHVIDKHNGGKADALNCGLNLSQYPLYCAVDADSILQRDSLAKVAKPFLADPDIIAAGGTVRIVNGCDVSGGYLRHIGLPDNLLALFQVMEYLRAFLFGRLGWSVINGMLVISGAFGLFKTQIVMEVGGYRTDVIGEDMELVVRLHRILRQQRRPYRICFTPEPVCWTETPESLTSLARQRIRWQCGLAESLVGNLGLLFSRRGGIPGWVAFPYMLIFEWLGPALELFGYAFMLTAGINGWLSWHAVGVFWLLVFSLGILLSFSGLLLEEIYFHLYPHPRHLVWLVIAGIAENFGYRQINTLWRIIGLYRWLSRRQNSWGKMERKGHWQHSSKPP